MVKPSVYILGGKPEIYLTPEDQDGNFFTPSQSRLSVKEPSGNIFTVSGADLTLASGYYFYDYKPATIGWYEYEIWVEDSAGREIVETNGFEVTDRVY